MAYGDSSFRHCLRESTYFRPVGYTLATRNGSHQRPRRTHFVTQPDSNLPETTPVAGTPQVSRSLTTRPGRRTWSRPLKAQLAVDVANVVLLRRVLVDVCQWKSRL